MSRTRMTFAAVSLGVFMIAGCSSSHAATPPTPTTEAVVSTTSAPPAATTIARAPTTTRPSTPTLPPAPAVSASFVSPDQGFALESNGKLVATTDGGYHWHAVGLLRRPSLGMKIRFIDSSDGFAFAPQSSVLKITHDGGATWVNVDKPFTTVGDLAISRGTIYAVGFTPGQVGTIGIWSTPVEHLVWKRDPLNTQIGAGPVPYEQFVFAGDEGWMLNVDRVVLPGARLDPGSNDWRPWAQICQGVGGPAELAASTGSDLVAVCSPGVASTTTKTFVEFSHDGGNTFTRVTLPYAKFGAGGVLSPSPDTAVVINGSELQRTTDDGATWRVVGRIDPNYGALDSSDMGFTTTMQGFVLGSYGPMLMTHDAGATWRPVTLP